VTRSILDMVRRNNYRILSLLLKLPTGFKQRDLDVGLVHAVKAGFFDCAKVLTCWERKCADTIGTVLVP